MTGIHTNFVQRRTARLRLALGALAGATLAGCNSAVDVAAGTADEEPDLSCGPDGHLSAQLYGAIETELEWDRGDLECTGMPRPDGKGVRLRLAALGEPGGHGLVFIIALPGFARDSGPAEFDSNTTVIEAGDGRFFSTPDTDNCLVNVEAVRPVDDSGDRFSVAGALYCVSPVPEVNGDSSVSIPELRFSGLLDWTAK